MQISNFYNLSYKNSNIKLNPVLPFYVIFTQKSKIIIAKATILLYNEYIIKINIALDRGITIAIIGNDISMQDTQSNWYNNWPLHVGKYAR